MFNSSSTVLCVCRHLTLAHHSNTIDLGGSVEVHLPGNDHFEIPDWRLSFGCPAVRTPARIGPQCAPRDPGSIGEFWRKLHVAYAKTLQESLPLEWSEQNRRLEWRIKAYMGSVNETNKAWTESSIWFHPGYLDIYIFWLHHSTDRTREKYMYQDIRRLDKRCWRSSTYYEVQRSSTTQELSLSFIEVVGMAHSISRLGRTFQAENPLVCES